MILAVVFYANPDGYPPTIHAIELLRSRFTVHLFCRNEGTPNYRWPSDVQVHRLGKSESMEQKQTKSPLRKLLEYRAFVTVVRRELRTMHPSLVIAYEPHALVAVSPIRGGMPPVIYHRHEIDDHDRLPHFSLQTWIYRYALHLTRLASLVVFPERNRAEYYLGLAGDTRAPMIVPNVPLRRSFPLTTDIVSMIDARWSAPVLIYRGRVSEPNGIVGPVSALPLLPSGIMLRLVGAVSDTFRSQLMSIASELCVDERIVIEGYLPNTEADQATMEASCGFALQHPVSRNWTYLASASNKIFEYAACGVPVIVPDRESYREYFAGESWVHYAEPSDAVSIAVAVKSVFSDRTAYMSKCKAARSSFENRFNYENVFQPVLDRIDEMTKPASTSLDYHR